MQRAGADDLKTRPNFDLVGLDSYIKRYVAVETHICPNCNFEYQPIHSLELNLFRFVDKVYVLNLLMYIRHHYLNGVNGTKAHNLINFFASDGVRAVTKWHLRNATFAMWALVKQHDFSCSICGPNPPNWVMDAIVKLSVNERMPENADYSNFTGSKSIN